MSGNSTNNVKIHGRIQRRLVLTFMSLLVGAMVTASSALLALRIGDLKNRMIADIHIRAETIATQIAPSLDFNEPTAATAILGHLVDDPSIRSAEITDIHGRPFAAFGKITEPMTPSTTRTHQITQDSLLVSVPVRAARDQIGHLTLSSNLSELEDEIHRSLLMSIPVNLAVIALTLLLMRRIVAAIVHPVIDLAETAAQIATEGDYSIRAVKFADDEIGGLTDRFNHMLETIEEQKTELDDHHARTARSERLESLGLLAGGVAHDLNNVLGPMVAIPEIVIQKLPDPRPVKPELELISKSAHRASVIIQDLLSLARRGTYKLEPININELVHDCLASPAVAQRRLEAPGVECSHSLEPDLNYAKGSEPHLTQALLNLIINGIEAMGQNGRSGKLTVSTANLTLDTPLHAYETIPAGCYTLISVKDEGPGLTHEMQKRIFEPFYTSKKAGTSGSGLGLAVVYGVVHDHGGFLDVISDPGEGAEFRLYLQAEISTGTRTPRQDPHLEKHTRARILVVDDYAPQRLLTAKLLETLGHETASAENGHQAVAILREDAGFDLMVVDMIMEDGFDGLDTYSEALTIKPDIGCIIATGFSETVRVKTALELGATTCLNKPFTITTLSKAVSEALEAPVALPS